MNATVLMFETIESRVRETGRYDIIGITKLTDRNKNVQFVQLYTLLFAKAQM